MSDEPVDLDLHRDAAGRMEAEVRRHRLQEFQADQEALRYRQEELEKLLLAAPANTWPETAAKVQYLLQILAATPEAQDPRRRKLIEQTLEDIARLCGDAE